MMNAHFWAMGEEAGEEYAQFPTSHAQAEHNQPQSPDPRRGSDSSILTVWPGASEEIVERDELGNVVETDGMTAPAAARLARHGLIHPDEFEMGNLDQPLPGPVDVDGFENQIVMRPSLPSAKALSHRIPGELVKPGHDFAEW